jgi:hypothetical protein
MTIDPYNEKHGLDCEALDKSLAALAQRKDPVNLTLNILEVTQSLDWINRTGL